MRAIYNVPFVDFNYTKLATDCGAKVALHIGHRLDVIGTPEVIATLSNNLDFEPDSTEG